MAAIKGREIIEALKGNHDPKLINILCSLAERQEVNHRQIIVVAEAYDRLVNMFARVVGAVHGMGKQADQLLARMGMTNTAKTVESIQETDDDTGGSIKQ